MQLGPSAQGQDCGGFTARQVRWISSLLKFRFSRPSRTYEYIAVPAVVVGMDVVVVDGVVGAGVVGWKLLHTVPPICGILL